MKQSTYKIVCNMEDSHSQFPMTAFCDLMKASCSVFRTLIDLMGYLSTEKRNELMAIAASIEDFAIRMKVEHYG